MEATVAVRHFELNNDIKKYAVDSMENAFGEFRLKIGTISMVLDMQKNLISASITVGIKNYPVTATSEAYDNVYKAMDEVISKAVVQARKYLDKKQDHKGGAGLKDACV